MAGRTIASRSSGWLAPHPIPSPGTVLASLVVGTILTLINQGDALFSGNLTIDLAWTIPLNYVLSGVLVAASGPLAGSDSEGTR